MAEKSAKYRQEIQQVRHPLLLCRQDLVAERRPCAGAIVSYSSAHDYILLHDF